jgi:hypothetical protein
MRAAADARQTVRREAMGGRHSDSYSCRSRQKLDVRWQRDYAASRRKSLESETTPAEFQWRAAPITLSRRNPEINVVCQTVGRVIAESVKKQDARCDIETIRPLQRDQRVDNREENSVVRSQTM